MKNLTPQPALTGFGFQRWRAAIAIAATIASLDCASRAMALDPSRALTQSIHRIWQTQQGLPQGSIYCILQTQDRYLWLGTKSGLVRFDGVQFTVISDVGGISLENVWIRQLAEDPHGALWIATDGDGLVRWQRRSATRFSVENGLPSNNIRSVHVDRHRSVWIGTGRGLARFVDGRVEIIGETDGPGTKAIEAICETSDGRIWMAGEGNQLYIRDAKGLSEIVLDSLPTTTSVTALQPGEVGSIWIGSSDGLVCLDGNQQQHYTTTDGLPENEVYCLARGTNDTLWIGTGDGFSRFRAGAFQSFHTRDGLSQSTVYAVCEDHEGTLWVGTKLGLNQFIDRRTVPFTIAEGLPSNNTGAIEQSANGGIWVGTLDAGLASYDGRRFMTLTNDDGLPGNVIQSLAAAGDNSLWVGTDQGLCRVENQKIVENLTAEPSLPSKNIRSLCCDARGTLWIGTSAGLAKLQKGSLAQITLPNQSGLGLPIAAIVEHGGHALVVGTDDGQLFEFQAGKWSAFETNQARPNHLTAFYSDGETLFATTAGNGLYVFQKGRITHLSVREGLYDDELFGIASDQLGQLWIACSKGVFSVQKENLSRFAEGKIATVPTTPLSPLDSLRTVECQQGVQPAVKLMRDGRVWFSTMRGVLVIDPRHWQRTLPPTSVVVEDVIINGKSEDPRQFQAVPPGNANLTFRYAALSYTSPARITYRYRLEGFDKQWLEAGGRREAFYTNIPPGEYKFVVAATNVDGKLYEAESPVQLRIAPRLHQTIWFLPACALVVTLGILLAYRLRVRAIRQKMNAIVIERSRIARELHDGLMQGFSGITMEMQALSSRLPEESAERETLEEVISDAGICLREARRSIAGLRNEQSGLTSSIEQAARQLTQMHEVRLELQFDQIRQRLPAETEYNLLRIAQEAITNAVKHSGADVVRVTLESAANQTRLTIHDNGGGFDSDMVAAPHDGHYGVVGMRERARQIGAQFTLQSSPGEGTTVCVVLPTAGSIARATS
jgi:signal transduction histidine kinase/ligand-binding sensor domain-containing protein